jgi:hypothetical protein
MSRPAPEPPRTTATWTGAELRDRPQAWAREWTTPLLDELVEMVDETGETDLAQLDPSTFAPTSIREFAADIRRDLIDGRGFTLVRGFRSTNSIGGPSPSRSSSSGASSADRDHRTRQGISSATSEMSAPISPTPTRASTRPTYVSRSTPIRAMPSFCCA